ncbi:MAG: hypothetical protein IJX93_02680 [Clostridia bacterium]|nr:hypothetical protein [Clostridia bacterium]MBQ8332663.1 hypothetical protein [Clostridia bacterium]MBQ8511434.1 hypothetical protein [Clostridia bacterium]
MLNVLQYAALISAFFLPFAVGFVVQSVKSGDRRKLGIAVAVVAAAVCIIGVTVWLAFGISGVSE